MRSEIIAQIKNDVQKLGLQPGDIVLMHSSLKLLGYNTTPPELLTALTQALCVGDDGGTLVLPALSYEHCNPQNPVFNYYKTPSNIGAIPEYFRTSFPGVIRSLCPTHSCCAVGAKAQYLTQSQHLDNTPCGSQSPFRKLYELGGKLLFVGCGTGPNTSMHAVEELIEPSYLWGGSYEYTLIDKDEVELKMQCKAHGFADVIQRYDRIESLLSDTDREIVYGKILNADCVMMDVKAVWDKALEKLREDQYYFVDFRK